MIFSASLKKNSDFRRLYARGKYSADALLALHFRPNYSASNRSGSLGNNRIGITVSSKLGNAVHRNKLRRRLHEIYRINEPSFRRGYDIVAVARIKAKDASFIELQKSFLKTADKLNLLNKNIP